MINKTTIPTMMQIRIFMSFHHICFLTLLAPRRKPCADTAKLSVLSWRLSRRSPRSETLLMLLRMTLTVESISCSETISHLSSHDVCRFQSWPGKTGDIELGRGAVRVSESSFALDLLAGVGVAVTAAVLVVTTLHADERDRLTHRWE